MGFFLGIWRSSTKAHTNAPLGMDWMKSVLLLSSSVVKLRIVFMNMSFSWSYGFIAPPPSTYTLNLVYSHKIYEFPLNACKHVSLITSNPDADLSFRMYRDTAKTIWKVAPSSRVLYAMVVDRRQEKTTKVDVTRFFYDFRVLVDNEMTAEQVIRIMFETGYIPRWTLLFQKYREIARARTHDDVIIVVVMSDLREVTYKLGDVVINWN